MKQQIKKIEQLVMESTTSLNDVKIKDRHTKYLGKQDKTHLNINIDFNPTSLSWLHITYQHGVRFQFAFILSTGISGEFYKTVQFGSDFYDQTEKEQEKRLKYFLGKYQKAVELITKDKNANLKKELLLKKQEIQAKLLEL